MANEDQTLWITFNGEIYNYRELRNELRARGHQFRTDSDTETIIHLYEEDGVSCLQKLRGMFAFAIWDQRRRRLFMARDRLGQKPLVYRYEPGRLLFASEIKSILQVPGVPREVDALALDEYLTYSYVPHPRTMFEGIRKLPPAHYAVFEDNRLTIREYWSPDLDSESSLALPDLRDHLDDLISESVRLRLQSDVPLGAFLSGGIDSTTIVGLMQRHLERAAKTYTIGFSQADYDETHFARTAANHLRTEHHQLQVQPESVELLPRLVWHFDEPFADSSAIPTYYLAQLTKQHVTVALTGDGGDELFAGYPRYRTVDRLSSFDRLPGALRSLLANRFWQSLPTAQRQSSAMRKLRFRMGTLRQSPEQRYVNWVASFGGERRRGLYTPEMARLIGSSDSACFTRSAMMRSDRRSAGTRAMHTDLQTYLPCDLLTKVDITSMAHGLECRSPFLDHRLVEFAVSLPFRALVQGRTVKPLLTETFSELIPPPLRNRGKMGFRIPLDDWFRGNLSQTARDLLLGPQSMARGYFRAGAIQNLLHEHRSARWNHGDRIWSLLCLEMWHRTLIDCQELPTAPIDASDEQTRLDLAGLGWRATQA